MEKSVDFQNSKVSYILKSSPRSKHVRLAVYGSGELVVTAPRGMDSGIVEKFIAQKSKWILEKLEYFKSISGTVFIKKSSRRDYYVQHKAEAHALVVARLAHFNQYYNFTYHRVSIKNQKTRWGSCSRKGNLNFNYKIALLPPRLVDYIIVHELCHLGELNHSRKFWNLLSQTIPDYFAIRAELKKVGVRFS